MLVVVALGGNALLRRGEPADVEVQRANVTTAVEAIVELASEHDVVVTHGNGPQVGLLALQGEAYPAAKPYPLDGPKVEAACRFAERTGGLAGIGALADAAAIMRGERGTRIRARSEVTA